MARLITEHILLLAMALGLLISQLLLKHGLQGGQPMSVTSPAELLGMIWRILTTPALVAGYGLAGACALVWLVLMSRLELSYASPMLTGIFYVLLMLASTFVLREAVSPWRWGATLLIVAGVALLSRTG